jgi:hypothetical protein
MLQTLTEEVLALAERLYLMSLARGETQPSVYHDGGGASAGIEQGRSAEENKKWLT